MYRCNSFEDKSEAIQSLSGVSWVFRGTAQQNNSVLLFNMYDTLTLVCRAQATGFITNVMFAIHKGKAPTDITGASSAPLTLSYPNGGTLVYSDLNGIESGFENFVISMNPVNRATYTYGMYAFRYVNVGTLMPADSGTYHCSGKIPGDALMMGSGALTITVNTKVGQARSSTTQFSHFMIYSAALMGATKFLF